MSESTELQCGDIVAHLKKNRPNLAVGTLYSYCSTLTALYKKVFGNNDIDVKKFDDTEKILKELETKAPSTRKTTLAILYVLTGKKEYQEQMVNDIETYKKEVSKQEMTESQKEAYLTQEQIKERYNELEQEAKRLYKKDNLTTKEMQQIQDYIILAITAGIYIPPRRALDWTAFKIKNIDQATDNYLNKNKLVFNTYKGSSHKGQQVIDAPKALTLILKKWMSVNPTDYLLHDTKGNSLNSVKLNQRLAKIFNKSSGTNVLRHSYLSEKFADSIKMNAEIEKTMKEMGSSSAQSKVYIQKLE